MIGQAMKNADANEQLETKRREREIKILSVSGMVSDFVAVIAKFMLQRSNSGPEEERLKNLISKAILDYVSANKTATEAIDYVAPKTLAQTTILQSPALSQSVESAEAKVEAAPRGGGMAMGFRAEGTLG